MGRSRKGTATRLVAQLRLKPAGLTENMPGVASGQFAELLILDDCLQTDAGSPHLADDVVGLALT